MHSSRDHGQPSTSIPRVAHASRVPKEHLVSMIVSEQNWIFALLVATGVTWPVLPPHSIHAQWSMRVQIRRLVSVPRDIPGCSAVCAARDIIKPIKDVQVCVDVMWLGSRVPLLHRVFSFLECAGSTRAMLPVMITIVLVIVLILIFIARRYDFSKALTALKILYTICVIESLSSSLSKIASNIIILSGLVSCK